MLSPQEALMMKAAYDEQERLQQQNTAGLLGAAGGGLMGAAAGTIPHSIGNAVNALKGTQKTPMRSIRPGFRAAGGLTGAILGGALGAGVASIMKSESPAARGMAQLQAGGDIDQYTLKQIEDELATVYNNPSQFM
jgi:hypothetical protein